MKSTNDLKILKERCLGELAEVLTRYEDRLREIDERVWQYAQDVCRTDVDIHNLDEVLGLRKFLRLLDTYEFDYDAVHDVIFDAEGQWEEKAPFPPQAAPFPQNADKSAKGKGHAAQAMLEHVEGGLKIDGIYGYGHYRQTPMQVFSYAWIYGFRVWKDTTSPVGSREMLPTERAGRPEGV